MADSTITITGLLVNPGVRQNVITLTATIGSCLPYLGLDKFEVWRSLSNNRALATKVGETQDIRYTDPGLTLGVSYWYWVRPRDTSGNLGDFYPLSATAGVVGIPISTGTDSVTPDDLNVPTLSDISVNFGTITAGLIQSTDGRMIIDLRAGFTKRIRISSTP